MEKQFSYNDEVLAARLKMLGNLARGNDRLNLVIGEKGSGKTTLLNALLASLGEEWRRCNLLFKSVGNTQKVEAVGNLNGRGGILLKTGHRPMLVIDDAHEIDSAGLCYLLRHTFSPGERQKIRGIILFCSPPPDGFVKTLSESLPGHSVTNTIYIKPLSLAQTTRYLQQFSGYLGLLGKNCFSSSQIKKIHSASRGLPGKIEEEANRMIDARLSHEKLGLFRMLACHNRTFADYLSGHITAKFIRRKQQQLSDA